MGPSGTYPKVRSHLTTHHPTAQINYALTFLDTHTFRAQDTQTFSHTDTRTFPSP